MRFRATALAVAALAFSATFASSAVAVPNVVDQYTEQLPSPTGPGAPSLTDPDTTTPGRPDDRQNSGPTAGNGPDSGLVDWLSAIGAPVPSGADLAALMEGNEDSAQDPAGGLDPDVGQAIEPSSLPGAEPAPNTEPAPQTETGGIGSGMGIVFPAILLLATAAAIASLFVRRGTRGQAGQD